MKSHHVIKPLAGEPYNCGHRNAGDPLSANNPRKVRQPKLVAHFHEVWALLRENVPQRRLAGPGVLLRQQHVVAIVDYRRGRSFDGIDSSVGSDFLHGSFFPRNNQPHIPAVRVGRLQQSRIESADAAGSGVVRIRDVQRFNHSLGACRQWICGVRAGIGPIEREAGKTRQPASETGPNRVAALCGHGPR